MPLPYRVSFSLRLARTAARVRRRFSDQRTEGAAALKLPYLAQVRLLHVAEGAGQRL